MYIELLWYLRDEIHLCLNQTLNEVVAECYKRHRTSSLSSAFTSTHLVGVLVLSQQEVCISHLGFTQRAFHVSNLLEHLNLMFWREKIPGRNIQTGQQISQKSFWTEVQRGKRSNLESIQRVWRHSMSAITKILIQTQEKSEAVLMTDTMPNIFTPTKVASKRVA